MRLTVADPEVVDKTKCFLNILLGIFWLKKFVILKKK